MPCEDAPCCGCCGYSVASREYYYMEDALESLRWEQHESDDSDLWD